MATDHGMSVEFKYWCKHDVSLFLQSDQAEFAGRARYWFGTPIFSNNDFELLADKSKVALGERFTPEYHLELPIAKTFEALGYSQQWWEDLNEQVFKWVKSISSAEESINEAIKLLKDDSVDIREIIDDLSQNLQTDLKNKTFTCSLNNHIKALEELSPKLVDMVNVLLDLDNLEGKSSSDQLRAKFYEFERQTNSLNKYFKSNPCQAAFRRNVLLVGEAGIGKSHLLCDVSFSRIKQGLPTVFILGQHYLGKDPLVWIKECLDLFDISNEVFLGALDAAGEAKKTRALIVIDAINEGNYREDWRNFLSSLLSDINRFPNISIVLSCRETYLDWVIPHTIINNQLFKVKHYGFKGYEHRAASIYLSKQGIVKPSAPIISPEFTNPLFLKTCCKAMKDRGLVAFPKGLHGITNLIDFYIQSIELTIAKHKQYRPGEDVVEKCLKTLALKLYPDHQFGLDLGDAMQLINDFDSRPNNGDPLYDLLLHEGVITEDMEVDQSTGKRTSHIVKFTYERFSDYFIASSLLERIDSKELENAFSETGCFYQIIRSDIYFRYTGILAAICIIAAEKFSAEIIDFLPKEITENEWLFEQVFVDTIQWRDPSSFTERTKELFNSIPEYAFYSRRLDILLALSTELNHPWNAEILHRLLSSMSMPERDAFWSTHVAISDSEEDDANEESIVRALIDWANAGLLDGVEPERIKLCSTVLIWMTTSSNRQVRDQATKSAVRILIHFPELLIHVLTKFEKSDDLYLTERLYAIAYGVVTNICNATIVKKVVKWVWEREFIDGKPTPHLLLRDYARGILEFALYKRELDVSINPEQFRPPYTSDWPLSIPTNEELEIQFGDDFSTSIKSSIMGFPGDFGNYTMSRIHNWSPSSIKLEQPETVYELQLKFANNLLKDELKKSFIEYLNIRKEVESKPVNFSEIELIYAEHVEEEPNDYDVLIERIKESLSPEDKEYFRWVIGLGRTKSIGIFSRKAAQRWVCKRAFELGWTKDQFEGFEKSYVGYSGRSKSTLERIGKKYQWIAFHEFLAHLADNCCYIDPGYGDVDYSRYYGPWQLDKRDIDPTLPLRTTLNTINESEQAKSWWRPFEYPFMGAETHEMQEWLWDKDIVPPFEKLLRVSDQNRIDWLVLRSFSDWKKEPLENNNIIPSQDAWYRINSCILCKKDVELLRKTVAGENLCSPDILKPSSTGHQGYYREFPWHSVYKDIPSWGTGLSFRLDCEVESLVPITEYEWESGNNDKSVENPIYFYLPAKELIDGLELSPHMAKTSHWVNSFQETIFYDPSICQKGPSTALVQADNLIQWLDKNDFQLVWLIGGEKQLFTHWASKFYGRLAYSGFYTIVDGVIEGELWFDRLEKH